MQCNTDGRTHRRKRPYADSSRCERRRVGATHRCCGAAPQRAWLGRCERRPATVDIYLKDTLYEISRKLPCKKLPSTVCLNGDLLSLVVLQEQNTLLQVPYAVHSAAIMKQTYSM